MIELKSLIMIFACIRLFYAGTHTQATAHIPKPVSHVDAGPLYVAPAGTGKATINGLEYRYLASKERESQIIEGFKKLRLGESRDDVRDALGPPDTADSMSGKHRDAPFRGWCYMYQIKMRDLANTNDVSVHVFFDPDGKLDWAAPSNIDGLTEIGSVEGNAPRESR